ncbi:hypothetical protein AA0472_1419 [Acetobacter estunensis NRIC 0472]|uniref:Peroxiredoxin n=1 Tax=Acetobacter estunensis TaxID=104097 RepID=A0A967EDD6_9PROT|nr:DsrE family protein [Acetobacter estunensis]NHO53890.1 hypothetical protein [Acetobacter estunensis]GBQ24424.1 hypothetical protein AA0472_1419 [Acetobacter estunensis NRIC 0472]
MTDPANGLAILLCDAHPDRLHAAFLLAAGALALDRPVLVFATGPATAALCRDASSVFRPEEEERLAERGVATLATLRDALVLMEAELMVCETGLRRIAREESDLLDGVKVVGIPTFLDQAQGRQIVSF